MSVAVEDRPLALGTGHGGMPARRAVLRWAWRLFRREWRQQSIVLALLLLAVAATTVGLGIGANAPAQDSVFGTADHLVTLGSTGAQLDADIDQLRRSFGTVDVIGHRKLPVPGSANGIDLRAQDPDGPYGRTTLRLDTGRWPHGPDEIAVTDRAARTFGLHVGGAWNLDGHQWTVVGRVENPLDLRDAFALVAPGRVVTPDRVDVLIRVSAAGLGAQPRPDGSTTQIRSPTADTASVGVLLLTTIGLVFVGLLAVAGFTVMAQRRLRALGMLGAMGASHRHIRLVVLANGLVIGAVGALAGAVVGIAGWVALSPRLEEPLGHRTDRFNLPWLPIAIAVLLASVTAVVAAWWPARATARLSVMAALSARPAPPRPAHRFAALGVVLLAVGQALLFLSQQKKAPFIVGGVLATATGLLLLAPAGVAAVGRLARRAPLAARLAMRDLGRYRARSSAALAAIGLAVGIAAVVAVSAAVVVAKAAAPTGGNLPADQMVVWLAPGGMEGPIPAVSSAQTAAARQQVDTIAGGLPTASVLPLTGAVDPNGPVEREGRPAAMLAIPRPGESGPGSVSYSSGDAIPLFVATPELLAHYGIDPATVDAGTDLLTSRETVDGYDLIPGRNPHWQPNLKHLTLPGYGSLPTTLITAPALTRLHLAPVPVGWLITAPNALTPAQVDKAQQSAAAAGLTVESRPTGADQARLADGFTVAGIAVALGVLAMTVGLIRSETARDLRTLTATGARRRTRRALTAATAGALALAGTIIGTACAYLALLAWYHQDLQWMASPPVRNLAAILIGLPVVAYIGGWLMAGREAPAIARQPLD